MNVRDAFYEVLRAHGITTIFGNPGSNEVPLLRDFPGDFRYILALQEGAAIGMADGFAQATASPALVNPHAAADTGNAMGNLTNTQSGHVPVAVTSGQQARRYTALNAMLTSIDAPKLAEPLVKWSNEPARPQDVPQALSQGILLASAAPAGPVYISLPLDDWDQEADVSALGKPLPGPATSVRPRPASRAGPGIPRSLRQPYSAARKASIDPELASETQLRTNPRQPLDSNSKEDSLSAASWA